jgi:hypothetical protein
MYVTINRARYSRDGAFFPARGYNRGRLRYGTQRESSLSDWYYDSSRGLLEIRLPWMLLNVSDPSTATLLYETTAGNGFGAAQAEGWHIGVLVSLPSHLLTLPAFDDNGMWKQRDFTTWNWAKWETPTWHEGRKPAYDAMRRTWNAMR